jgi:hypothetical protein
MNQLAEQQIGTKADLLVDPGRIMQVGTIDNANCWHKTY